jgi:O-6-methylguanine DNA methyltransferase
MQLSETPVRTARVQTIRRREIAVNEIMFSIATSGLGEILVARSANGVCAILIGSDRDELEGDLARRFPGSRLIASEISLRNDVEEIIRFTENPTKVPNITLDMRGTAFQKRVWEALRTIPSGTTISYTQLAALLNEPNSARAVASACAANAIALAVPCHRIVRGDGELSGYRWGVERKRQLINIEALV